MKKKIFLIVSMAVLAICTAAAQPRAIGGRLGYGLDVSYQHNVGRNKVTLDVGLPWFSGLEAVATHDWVIPVHSWSGRGAWNWYPGVGLGIGGDFYGHRYNNTIHSFFVGVAGRFGFEYQFWFPMTIAVDWRPVFGIETDFHGDTWFGRGGLTHLGLSLYYNF